MESNHIPPMSTDTELNNFKEDCKNNLHTEVPCHLFQYVPFKSNTSELQNVCRICLKVMHETKVSLLSFHDSEMLGDILKSFTSIQVYPQDDLPLSICGACHDDVVHCYMFKAKCEKSDFILQSLSKSQILIEGSVHIKNEEVQENNPENFVAKEEVIEDIAFDMDMCKEEYLEDLFQATSDNEALCIEQNTNINEKDELKIIFTDTIGAAVKPAVKPAVKAVKSKRKPKKPHTCNICLKKFDMIKNLKIHISRKHVSRKEDIENNSYPCDWCKQSFSSTHDLEVHSALHSPGPLCKCNKCSKEFTDKTCLRRHVQRHMERKRFSCASCGKAFCELYALRRHERVHTGEAREKKFACHLCDKKYSESVSLKTHLLQHAGARLFACATCGKGFASARLLASHRLVHSDAKPYACAYCDKRFRHDSTRITHHRTHTGEKPYVCAVCGKTFIQNSNLTLHMRTHTGEKPYSCDKCGQRFKTGSALKGHQTRHTGEKPYACDICGKKFARRDMRIHRRSHTGERPHACAVCAAAFASAARLREHARIHTGEKPYECSTCKKSFGSKTQLSRHFKKHEPRKRQAECGTVAEKREKTSSPATNKDAEQKKKQTEKKEMTIEVPMNDNVTLQLSPVMPLHFSEELLDHDECDVKEIIVDSSQNENEDICLNESNVNFVNSNVMTVNEGSTVKLYQVDQSLVQIHTSGGQLTISKITSSMTANF